MPTKAELRETAAALRRLLAAVERGEMTAPASLLVRLEDAAALDAVSEGRRQAERGS